MNQEQKDAVLSYEEKRERYLMLRDFFEQLFYEFQMQSRRKPDEIVNRYKAEHLNRVLLPLREMMKDEPYAAFLEEIPAPETTVAQDGKETVTGLTYSDAALMMAQYKGAVNRFFQNRI